MRKYKYLLFDADNTLFDFDASERAALELTLSEMPLGFSKEVAERYHEINDREWKRLEKGETTREKLRVERFEKLYSTFGLDGASLGEKTADIYVKRLSEQHILLPESLETVKALSDGYDVYLITNGITTVQRARLAASPIKAYIRGAFISQEMGTAKPQKEYFDKVLSSLSAEKDECLVIGDSLTSDIAGAIASGIDCCWYNPRGEVNNGGSPTYIFKRLTELYAVLKG